MDEAAGHHPSAVIDLMRMRRHQRGDAHHDGRKLALVVEGGGMRGVLSAGALLALDVLGYRGVFDEVYATSAGAVNAAYFLSGQGRQGITVYFDDICNRRFINPLRVWKIVDVEFVYDQVVTCVKPLDEHAVRTQPAELFFSVTDVETGENRLLDVKALPDSIPRMLRATSALPVLYNRPVEVDGRAYVDGGATCTLPILQAAERGCTDVLVVVTKATGYRADRATRLRRAILYCAMGRRYPRMMDAYGMLAANGDRDRALAEGIQTLDQVSVATFYPSAHEIVVDRMTMDRSRLLLGAERMALRTARLMGDDPAPVREAFSAFGTARPTNPGSSQP